MKNIHPTALIILDGFGYSAEKKYNAIAHAHMPYFNAWWQQYPHALLRASGSAVGLPDNMIGNSEVGHLTIGAGRVIDQPMKQWLEAIADGSFADNEVLKNQLEKLHRAGGALHIIGLLSDAGIHAHEKQIYAVIDAAIKAGIKKIVVHPILDGRDVPPQSAHHYLKNLSLVAKYYNHGQIVIGSLHGRFYAMDRDNNWDRIEKSYRVLIEKQEHIAISWEKVLERNYAHNITDEFIPPTQLDSNAIIHNGDGIIFCNVRPDRARELTMAFTAPSVLRPSFAKASKGRQESDIALATSDQDERGEGRVENEFHHFTQKPINLTFFITPVSYGDHLQTTSLFPRPLIVNALKDVLAEHHKTIFSIAETEKYAHVTYFFRGENEEPVATETRKMIHSMDLQSYAASPEMRASEITHAVVESLQHKPADFYLINYANADMVGHSGNFGATIKAVEFLDQQLNVLYEHIVKKMNGTLYITADHGKAEDMFDEDIRQPRTAHTNNKVPFLMINSLSHEASSFAKAMEDRSEGLRKASKGTKNGSHILPLQGLVDIAPFILQNMKLPVPEEMKVY